MAGTRVSHSTLSLERLLLRLDPLGWTTGHCLVRHLVLTWAHLVVALARVHLLSVRLSDEFAMLIFLISEHEVVRGDRWRIWHQCSTSLTLVPPSIRLSLPDPVRLFKVLTRSWNIFLLSAELATLETLHLGGKTSVRLDELDAKLVQTELLQCLCTLLVSVNLVKSVRHVVTSRA